MSSISLSNMPKKANAHIWADYIEIVCLGARDNCATIHDVEKAGIALDATGVDGEILEGYENSSQTSRARPRISDKIERRINDGLSCIERRVSIYQTAYPFEYNPEESELSLKSDLSREQRLYLSLLLCANHGYVRGENSFKELTSGFEIICFHALKGMLPEEGEVRLVGTKHDNDNTPAVVELLDCSALKIDKFKAIAAELSTVPTYDEDIYKPGDIGESGGDLIAWLPMQDDEVKREELVFIAQCTTSKSGWADKQGDASPDKWKVILGLVANNVNILFIAASPRRVDGKFDSSKERNSQAIWVDRQRIIHKIMKVFLVSDPITNVIPPYINSFIDEVSQTAYRIN